MIFLQMLGIICVFLIVRKILLVVKRVLFFQIISDEIYISKEFWIEQLSV